jgi:hypothetical protein
MMHRFMFATFFLTLACDNDSNDDADLDATDAMSDDDGSTDAMVDADAVLAEAAQYATWTRVTDSSMPSQHGLAATVHVWVPPNLADAYRSITSGTAPAFEPGTLLVKEHLDADGMHAGLTVMFKGPAGLAPETGDWWWAAVDAEGAPIQTGQIAICTSCHTTASSTGFVYGLP